MTSLGVICQAVVDGKHGHVWELRTPDLKLHLRDWDQHWSKLSRWLHCVSERTAINYQLTVNYIDTNTCISWVELLRPLIHVSPLSHSTIEACMDILAMVY